MFRDRVEKGEEYSDKGSACSKMSVACFPDKACSNTPEPIYAKK